MKHARITSGESLGMRIADALGGLILLLPRPAARRRRRPSAEEAFRGDWERLGKDMRKAAAKVRADG